ncbi:MAG: T9SS type A sorting domain-containing protein [bacterium]|nr:T9SS type A sorting domain-containing protein [bacterium]
MRLKHIAPALLLLIVSIPVLADMEWRAYSDPAALNAIAFTDDFIWAGGQGGLVQVDRETGATGYITTSDGLPMLDIADVVCDDDGDIWVATTAAGLLCYSPNAHDPWLRYQAIPNFLISDEMLCLEVGPTGRIWYGTLGGFGVIESNGPGQVWYDQHGLLSEEVECLAFRADTLLIGTRGGIYYMPPGEPLVFDSQAPFSTIESIFATDGRIWCLSDGNIWYRDLPGTDWTILPLPIGDVDATALCQSDSEILVTLRESGGADNIYRYDPDGADWTALPALVGVSLPSYSLQKINTMQTDTATGDIWLSGFYEGGMGTGLVSLSGDAWVQEPFDDRPLGGEINVMNLGPSGTLWAMSTVGGASLADDLWTRYPSDPAFSSLPRFGLATMEDSSGRVWFSRYSGSGGALGWFRPGTTESEIIFSGSVLILCMAEDADGNCWFSHEGQGIHVLGQDDSWNTLSAGSGHLVGDVVDEIDFLPDGRVAMLVRSHKVIVWDTNGTLLDESDDTIYRTTQSSTANPILDVNNYLDSISYTSSLCTTPEGDIWVGQEDGIVRIESGFRRFDVRGRLGEKSSFANGLINPNVNDVAAAPDGSVWAATERGLAHVDYTLFEEDGTTSWMWTVENWTNELGLAGVDEDLFDSSILAPLSHFLLRQVEISPDGKTIYCGTNFGVTKVEVTPTQAAAPELVEQAYVYPNPARYSLGHTAIRLGGIDNAVLVTIYNIEGQIVAESGLVEPGEILWDLETRFGNKAVSGVYLARLEYRGVVSVREIVIVQ